MACLLVSVVLNIGKLYLNMMIRNYLRIALRNMAARARFTVLHILGLSVALASVILITWYVMDELDYDRLPDADRVFRINSYWGDDPRTNIYATTPPPLAAAIRSEIPEVVNSVRAFNWNHSTMRLPAEEAGGSDEVVFRETRIFIVDPEFLDVMQYPLVAGDRASAFDKHEAIVVTKETALRYFGQAALDEGQVVGKTILFGGDRMARIVTAVVDPPANTHLHFDMLVNINFGYTELDTIKVWTWNIMHTYAKLSAGIAGDPAALQAVQSKLTALGARFIKSAPDAENVVQTADFRLQAVRDIHLHSHFLQELEPNGDYATVQLLIAVAVLIALLAVANFVNLFTAQSLRRAREVGVRKTLGSTKRALALQFFIESTLYSLAACVVALSLAELMRVPFNALSGKHLQFKWLDDPLVLGGLLAEFALVILLSAAYPALYLSSFDPLNALKGKLMQQKSYFRNGLVVLQFSISVGLMICSVFILRQLEFMQGRAPGYDRENVIVVKNDREIQDQWRTFRQELEKVPQISKVSFTTGLPVQPLNMMRDFRREGELIGTGINVFLVDEHYHEALGLTLVKGAPFSDNPVSNAKKILLNEAAVRELGIAEAVGQRIVLNYGSPDEERLEVIGVVKDFNVESLHSGVRPLVLYYYQPDATLDYIAVRIRPGNPAGALAEVEKMWRKFEPENPFVYSFLDRDVQQQYLSEQRLGRLFGVFTCLTICIALLGLTALVSFMAEQRTKEIGIRKVLGASVTGIIGLFSKEFVKLALIAMCIAVPASYFVIRAWLSDFAYRIEIAPGVFAACCLLSLLLMLITVAVLSMRVAKLDPAKTLKTE